MTEVLDVRAVQRGSWWMVSVPGMPGLMAQVSSLEPRNLSAALASASVSSDAGDLSVRRVQVSAASAAHDAGLDTRQQGSGGGRASDWTHQAVRATRLAPRRVAELLAG
jgi:hypothetical protein